MKWSIAPYFIVADVVATANFYRDKLGFAYDRIWGEPKPVFCIVHRSGIAIMLKQVEAGGQVRPNSRVDDDAPWDAYIWVDDADALRNEFGAKGVTIARELCDQEYGNRDFDVEDCNGYRLCFGHDIESRSTAG